MSDEKNREKPTQGHPTLGFEIVDAHHENLGNIRVPNKGMHESNLAAAGRSEGEKQAAQQQIATMTKDVTAYAEHLKQKASTQSNPEQTIAKPAKQATTEPTPSRFQAAIKKIENLANKAVDKAKSVIDRMSGQRDNQEKMAGQNRQQQQERGKENGR